MALIYYAIYLSHIYIWGRILETRYLLHNFYCIFVVCYFLIIYRIVEGRYLTFVREFCPGQLRYICWVCDRLKSQPGVSGHQAAILGEGEDVPLMRAYTLQHPLIYRLWFCSLADNSFHIHRLS